jgi:hypothetical protein
MILVAVRERGLQDCRFATEGQVERLHGNAGGARDTGHRGLEIAVAHEQRPGRRDDAGAGGAGPFGSGIAGLPTARQLEPLAGVSFHY